MNAIATFVPFALAAVLAAAPAAAQHAHDPGLPVVKPAGAAAQSSYAEGDVRKIDRVKGTVTLRHGPLPMLGMGPMTMMFEASDPKLLANVKEGDKVRFTPVQKDGKLVVTKIEVVK